jgi:hypothetical protein
LRQKVKEIHSSLIVLQQAIQNENDYTLIEHYDDVLEVIIEYAQKTLEMANGLSDEIENSQKLC